jgi:hypothetical protein
LSQLSDLLEGLCIANMRAQHKKSLAQCFAHGRSDKQRRLQPCVDNLQRGLLWPRQSSVEAAVEFLSARRLLFLGDSTVQNKWSFLHARGVRDVCHADGGGACYTPLQKTLGGRTDFDVVVWNTGLHWLQRPDDRDPMAGHTLAQYATMLCRQAHQLRVTFPGALFVYKLTNSVCVSSFVGRYARAAAAPARDPAILRLGGASVRQMNVAEHAVASQSDMVLLDPRVEGQCNCTGRGDGRHYYALIPNFIVRLHQLVQHATLGQPREVSDNATRRTLPNRTTIDRIAMLSGGNIPCDVDESPRDVGCQVRCMGARRRSHFAGSRDRKKGHRSAMRAGRGLAEDAALCPRAKDLCREVPGCARISVNPERTWATLKRAEGEVQDEFGPFRGVLQQVFEMPRASGKK